MTPLPLTGMLDLSAGCSSDPRTVENGMLDIEQRRMGNDKGCSVVTMALSSMIGKAGWEVILSQQTVKEF